MLRGRWGLRLRGGRRGVIDGREEGGRKQRRMYMICGDIKTWTYGYNEHLIAALAWLEVWGRAVYSYRPLAGVEFLVV